eukprot:6213618-Pleurochrysis_carterae.AAC.1
MSAAASVDSCCPHPRPSSPALVRARQELAKVHLMTRNGGKARRKETDKIGTCDCNQTEGYTAIFYKPMHKRKLEKYEQ